MNVFTNNVQVHNCTDKSVQVHTCPDKSVQVHTCRDKNVQTQTYKPTLLAKMIDFDPFLAGNGQNTNNLILKLCPIHVCR